MTINLQKAEDCLASLRHFIEAVTLRGLYVRISIFPEDIDLTGTGEFFKFEVMKYKCGDSQKYAILCNGFCLINSDEIESENFDVNEWIKIDFMVLEVYQGDVTEFLLRD